MRSVSIDEIHFLDAFGRDADFHDLGTLTYWIYLVTGDIIWFMGRTLDYKFLRL